MGTRFANLGYALLIVDSYGPRNIKQLCAEYSQTARLDRTLDAYGGLLYLASLPFVDPERIAVVGYSQGAMVALSAVARGAFEGVFDHHFRAAVAYYPVCAGSSGSVSVPTLVLIGALDDWTPAQDCQDMMAKRSGEGAPLRLIVYPGAYHSFNAASLRDKPRTVLGHHLEYNEAADHAAWHETVEMLRQAFGH